MIYMYLNEKESYLLRDRYPLVRVQGQGNTISSIAITDGMDEIKRIIRTYESYNPRI